MRRELASAETSKPYGHSTDNGPMEWLPSCSPQRAYAYLLTTFCPKEPLGLAVEGPVKPTGLLGERRNESRTVHNDGKARLPWSTSIHQDIQHGERCTFRLSGNQQKSLTHSCFADEKPQSRGSLEHGISSLISEDARPEFQAFP